VKIVIPSPYDPFPGFAIKVAFGCAV